MAATKTANVSARIDQSVKTQAEAILSRIGLPRSVAIDAFYRQIIIHGGIPFPLTIPESKLPAYDEMSVAEFNQMMAAGLAQAKADDSFGMDEVFEELEAGPEG
jgi:addiction module RelB/DinJ family antitoxin